MVFLHNLNFFINLKPIQTKKKEDIYFLYRFFEDNKVELKMIIYQLTEFLLSGYKNEKNNFLEKIIKNYSNENKNIQKNEKNIKNQENEEEENTKNEKNLENTKNLENVENLENTKNTKNEKNVENDKNQDYFIINKKNNIIILLSFLHDIKIIKTNKQLSLIAQYLSKIIIKKMKKSQKTITEFNSNLKNSKKLYYSSKIQKLNISIFLITKGLILTIKSLNKNNYSLFYNKEIINLMLFLSENLLNFNLKISKKLTKLKAKLHINFKTFDKVEICLRRNTNFMNIAIENFSNCDKENNLCILAISKSLAFLSTMLKYLPIKCFNQAFFQLLYKFSIKLFQIENATLIRENLLLFGILYKNLENRNKNYFEVIKPLVKDRLGFELCLELRQKIKNDDFVINFWRLNLEVLYFNFKKKSSGTKILEKEADFYILDILFFLAEKRFIDFFRFYIFIFGGLIHKNREIYEFCVLIINKLLKIDSRILDNNLSLEITKNLLNSFSKKINFKKYFSKNLENFLFKLDKKTLTKSIWEFFTKLDFEEINFNFENSDFLFLLLIFGNKKLEFKNLFLYINKIIKNIENFLLEISEIFKNEKIDKNNFDDFSENSDFEENEILKNSNKIKISKYKNLLRKFYIIIFLNCIYTKEIIEEQNLEITKKILKKIKKLNYLEYFKFIEKKIFEMKIKNINCFFKFKIFLKNKFLSINEINNKNLLCNFFNEKKNLNLFQIFENEDLNFFIFDDNNFFF